MITFPIMYKIANSTHLGLGINHSIKNFEEFSVLCSGGGGPLRICTTGVQQDLDTQRLL